MSSDFKKQVVQLAKSGKKKEALEFARDYAKANPNSEDAWWLIANMVKNKKVKKQAAEHVVRINPNNDKAQALLASLQDIPSASQKPSTETSSAPKTAPASTPEASSWDSTGASDSGFSWDQPSGDASDDPWGSAATESPWGDSSSTDSDPWNSTEASDTPSTTTETSATENDPWASASTDDTSSPWGETTDTADDSWGSSTTENADPWGGETASVTDVAEDDPWSQAEALAVSDDDPFSSPVDNSSEATTSFEQALQTSSASSDLVSGENQPAAAMSVAGGASATVLTMPTKAEFFANDPTPSAGPKELEIKDLPFSYQMERDKRKTSKKKEKNKSSMDDSTAYMLVGAIALIAIIAIVGLVYWWTEIRVDPNELTTEDAVVTIDAMTESSTISIEHPSDWKTEVRESRSGAGEVIALTNTSEIDLSRYDGWNTLAFGETGLNATQPVYSFTDFLNILYEDYEQNLSTVITDGEIVVVTAQPIPQELQYLIDLMINDSQELEDYVLGLDVDSEQSNLTVDGSDATISKVEMNYEPFGYEPYRVNLYFVPVINNDNNYLYTMMIIGDQPNRWDNTAQIFAQTMVFNE